MQQVFVDTIMLPALETAVGVNNKANLPVSYQAEKMRSTNSYGQLVSRSTVLNHNYLGFWVETMISLLGQSDLSAFEGFFFLSYCYGTKIVYDIRTGVEGVKTALFDLDFSEVEPNNVYFDLATNILPRTNQTLLWRVEPFNSSPNSSPLLGMLFPNTTLSAVKYRHDMFAHVQNLGGFKYEAPSSSGVGEYDLYMAQAYMGFKVPFFSRSSSGARHTIDVKMDQLYNKETSDIFTFVRHKIPMLLIIMSLIFMCYRPKQKLSLKLLKARQELTMPDLK